MGAPSWERLFVKLQSSVSERLAQGQTNSLIEQNPETHPLVADFNYHRKWMTDPWGRSFNKQDRKTTGQRTS